MYWPAALSIREYLDDEQPRRQRLVELGPGVPSFLRFVPVAPASQPRASTLAPGSTLVMSFMLPIELAEPDVRPGIEAARAVRVRTGRRG